MVTPQKQNEVSWEDTINPSCSRRIWTFCATISDVTKILSALEVVASHAGSNCSEPHRYVELN
jgi:hypothetical protein